MKTLIVLLTCLVLLSSCGIKKSILNYGNSSLGIPQQEPIVNMDQVEAPQTDHLNSSQVDDTFTRKPETNEKNIEAETSVWFYVIPFAFLLLLGILVHRMKKQNLKSL